MINDKMGAEDGTVIDAGGSLEPENGKGFISRRVAFDPLLIPYSRLVYEVKKEIILATYEQRKDLPKTATKLEHYDERNGRAATPDPAAVRGRIQGLLIDGLLTAFIREPSGRVFSVSLHAFAHNSEPVFDAMEQGHKITVPAMPENIIVDFDPTTDTLNPSPYADASGMVTGTVFFREDNFRAACAADPVEIDYGEPAPQATTPQIATPQANAPQATTPHATTPQTTTPQTTTPQIATPQANAPQATTPHATTPQTTTPQTTTPQTTTPQTTTPQANAPQATTPQTTTPQTSDNKIKQKPGPRGEVDAIWHLVEPVLRGDYEARQPNDWPDFKRMLCAANGDKPRDPRVLENPPHARVKVRYVEWARANDKPLPVEARGDRFERMD